MPKISDEQYDLIKQHIRKYMITHPAASIREVASAVNRQKDFVSRVMDEVRQEALDKINNSTIAKEVAEYEEHIVRLTNELYKIIEDEKSSRRDRQATAKTIAELTKSLMDVKFDAGLHERDLGKVKMTVPGLVEQILGENDSKPEKPVQDAD